MQPGIWLITSLKRTRCPRKLNCKIIHNSHLTILTISKWCSAHWIVSTWIMWITYMETECLISVLYQKWVPIKIWVCFCIICVITLVCSYESGHIVTAYRPVWEPVTARKEQYLVAYSVLSGGLMSYVIWRAQLCFDVLFCIVLFL